MDQFLIIANPHKERIDETIERIKNFLESKGKKCQIDCEKREIELNGKYESSLEIPDGTDCIIVVGGDGTLIRAARDCMNTTIPILGVNMGTLGYLTAVEVDEVEKCLTDLLDGNYEIEERMRLYATLERDGVTLEDNALNEICITRAGSLKILSFNIYINGEFLYTYHADGMIFATPTGSTAYNLSAGGPIVKPGAKMMILTPVCPHSLNSRSIVVSDSDQITIKLPDNGRGMPQEAELNFDGRTIFTVKTGDVINITKSKKVTRLIKLSHRSFLETVHMKMMTVQN